MIFARYIITQKKGGNELRIIHSEKAPAAVGPYSQGIEVNGLIYLSGMLPIDPVSGDIEATTVADQTKQVLENITALLQSQGLLLNDVVKTTIFLQSMDDFNDVNNVYSNYFNEHKPVRSCVAVKGIPKGALVEIEVISRK